LAPALLDQCQYRRRQKSGRCRRVGAARIGPEPTGLRRTLSAAIVAKRRRGPTGGESSEFAACPDCSYANTPYFLSPAASAAAVHLTVSRAMNCANSSGGPPMGSKPCARSLATTSSEASALLAAALSLSITARGVPAGATKPNQTPASKSGSPASTMVGTFGATCARLAELAARAFRPPASSCGMIVEATPRLNETRPGRGTGH